MTKEEIETAHDKVHQALNSSMSKPDQINAALAALNALCEAARQPESLVGKRARIGQDAVRSVGKIVSVKIIDPIFTIQFDGWTGYKRRDEFELLEETDGK